MHDQKWLDQAVVVALGCSLPGAYPSRQALLEAAVEALAAEGLAVAGRSSWWTSAAWPDPYRASLSQRGRAGRDDRCSADDVLATLHRIEARFGRVRAEANAPRTLDLDLIAHGRAVLDGAVIVPHPRAHERLFVMGPLAQIAPDWRHPVSGRAAADLAATATVGTDATPWLEAGTHTRPIAPIQIAYVVGRVCVPIVACRASTLPNFNSRPIKPVQ
jgi:2-amino-4-hydroxy-6-hydroxymethyldihydropteridine diphosphokinase